MSHKRKKQKQFQPIPRERALVPYAPAGIFETMAIEEAKQRATLVAAESSLAQKKPKKSSEKRARRKKRRRVFWSAVAALFVTGAVSAYFVLDIPEWQTLDPAKLEKVAQTSRMYDKNGALVTALQGPENRTVVPLSKIPVDVRNAFIAAEDLRFYQHNGFDLVRIFGALVADIRSQSYTEGASTISQQLIKATHLSAIKTFARKAEELFLSIQLESRYTKDQILEMYLNRIYFGEGAYGIEAAAQTYFGKSAAELTVTEGAALAATLKAPSAYGLTEDAAMNKTRRGYILRTMIDNGMLTPEAGEAAIEADVVAAERTPRERRYGWYIDAAMEEAERLLGITPDELLTGGYYIETALDKNLQTVAEELFANDKNFPANASDGTKAQGALAVVDVQNGALLAVVGGREYAVRRGFNRATDMRRQPGSAIKPLAVYAPAIEMGYTTASVVLDEREDFGGGYNPRNSGNSYHGPVTLRRALALSLNVATVRLMKEIGVGSSINFLKRAGIPVKDTDWNLSLALGAMTTGVTPAELAASYALFGNMGEYNAQHVVTRISGPDGITVYSYEPAPKRVLSPQNSFLMTSLMQSVTAWGTGGKLSATGLAVAGKTGTNSLVGRSGNRDIWMAAYTSDYALACWMGFDNTDATHHLPAAAQGGGQPAALATAFLKAAYKDQQKPAFKSPGGLVWLTIDTAATEASGSPMLAGSYTPADYKQSEVFLESNRPWQTSNIWQAPRACSYFYIDSEKGYPKLVFGASDSARYRVERVRNGSSVVLTELYGAAGQTLSYTDWNAAAGEWYTYRVTPLNAGLLETGVVLEGPASTQSVQARAASGGLLGGVVQWLTGGP